MSSLVLRNVSFSYNNDRDVLKNISLDIPKGIDVAILGPSGCGKSTLLNLMSGLISPSGGEIFFDRKKVSSPIVSFSMIFQDYCLFDWKNVYDNLVMPLRLKGKKIDVEDVESLARMLKIDDKLYSYPSELSGGEKQRVAIGRALIDDAEFILMDEPFSALDPLTREVLRYDIGSILKDNNATMIIVTHSIEEAVFFGDKIVLFTDKSEEISEVIDNKFSGREALDVKSEEDDRSGISCHSDMINYIRRRIFEREGDFY